MVASRLKTIWAHYLHLREEAERHGRYLPSTAPCYPTPGKKFMIIRTELTAPLENLPMGFDSIGKVPSFDELTEPVSVDDALQSKPDGKKKWALLGLNKVLPLKGDPRSPDDDAERGSRLSLPPSKAQKTSGRRASRTSSRSSESASRAESPITDSPQYIFRFVLNWYPPAAMPPAERILSHPRLPAPARSWVNARHGSGSEPPAAPPITRRISGSTQTGLINEARNATPLDGSEPVPGRTSISSVLTRTTGDKSSPGGSQCSSLNLSQPDGGVTNSASSLDSLEAEGDTQPVKPTGVFARSAVYSGRALAEWSIVVHECNTFAERRREEGVLALADVEVPTLSLENYRRIG